MIIAKNRCAILLMMLIIVASLANADTSPKISKRLSGKIQTTSADSSFKVWIYFTDKDKSEMVIQKTALAMSPRSTKRRANIPIDEYDLPVRDEYINAVIEAGGQNVRASKWLNAVSATVTRQRINSLLPLPFVEKIDVVFSAARKPIVAPSMPLLAPDIDKADYGLSFTQNHMLGVDSTHALGYNGTGVLIALMDTGFLTSHESFESMIIIDTYDFINNDTDVSDSLPVANQVSHGTSSLSICGGYSPGMLIGPAYNAQYLLYKTEIINQEIMAEEDNWVFAAERASDSGADIISTSLGYSVFDDTSYTYEDMDGNTAIITKAADIAVSRGILVVTSAGNEGNKPWHYITAPADADSVLSVGAIMPNGSIVDFSSFGPTFDGRIKPEVVAMGVSVVCANGASGGFSLRNGTSFSAPQIAGAAALVLQANPQLTGLPFEIRRRIIQSGNLYPASDPGNQFGYGLPRIFNASKSLRIVPLPVVYIVVGSDTTITITVDTALTSVTIIMENIPNGFDFIDNGNSTAQLTIAGLTELVGSRIYQIIADDGYTSDTAEFRVITLSQDSPFSVGPNPFTEFLQIQSAVQFESGYDISIFALSGELVFERHISDYRYIWYGQNQHSQNIASGVYFLLITADGIEERVKLLKL